MRGRAGVRAGAVAACLCLALALTGAARVRAGATQQAARAEPPIRFDRDIRPILSNNCFQCHGPDEQTRETDFHFDTEEGAFLVGGIIVAGSAETSELYRRITNPDLRDRMPPADSGYKLTEPQIQLLRRWIDEGATWSTHWAYTPPEPPDLPPVRRGGWARNPIDRFVLARLEREGLTPSPEADKATLLRRVTYDLTGLPPTPAEVDAFLADRSPDAYERRVDAMLASPRYGERMAMPWLDAARYGDTHGYHIDSLRAMWPWRDWVIGAFNRNMPFDQFAVEQLAGDLLPEATRDQKIASGFNRNHMINFEGGAIAEEYQVEYVMDRAATTSSVFMGLTMGCARCHSHKFDPISHKEFYQFYAFFNNVPERGLDGRTGNAPPLLALPTPDQERRLAELDGAIKATQRALADAVVEPQQREWEASVAKTFTPLVAEGLIAHYALDNSFADQSGRYQDGRMVTGDPTFEAGRLGRAVSFDGDSEVTFGDVGGFERTDPFSLAVWVRGRGKLPMAVLQKIEEGPTGRRGYEIGFDDVALAGVQRWAGRLVVTLASGGPERAIQVRTRERLRYGEWSHVAVTWDASGRAAGLRVYVNGEPAEVDVLRDALSDTIAAAAPLRVGNKTTGTAYLGSLDDLRLYSRVLTPDEVADLGIHGVPKAIIAGLYGKRTAPEATAIRDYFLTHAAPEPLRAAYSERARLQAERQALEAEIPTTMVMAEMETPRETFILARGDYRNRTEKVEPDVPAILPPLPKSAPRNRLALAKWLVDPGHPLTARVAVNRFWQMYFGIGLVKTQEDFGVQGEPPSHPELLDWLATEFVRTGWDVKAMQRLIVTSATYRQASAATPALLEKDPENRLLARAPRLRLPAEMIRDTALAASGLLNGDIGGPSVLPYQPPGLWEEMAFGEGFTAQAYVQSHGRDLYRRGLYTFWKRTVPPASLATFDAPDREKCTARRAQTNTPLQALALLNDPTYVEAARALAERAAIEAGAAPEARITHAFRLGTGRRPAAREVSVLRNLFEAQLASYRRNRTAAEALIAVGESPRRTRMDAAELAAWTMVASTILNLDETITRH
jgi:hypothetical protein